MRICRDCGDEFNPFAGKQGFVDQCAVCSDKMGDVPKVGGNMVWAHKTAPELEIKSMAEAKLFAKKQKRFGAGVTSTLVASQMTSETRESSKQGSGAEDHAQYTSPLGEKMTVKR